jgi:phosphinothricin acetyltransferase
VSSPIIRDATPADIPAVAAIYDQCVRDTVATFDTEERGAAHLGTALASLGPTDGFLVLDEGGVVLGYAVSGAFRPRPAYAGTRETSVYLARQARGRGWGRLVYAALLARLDAAGAHTQVAVVARPNEPSEALHRALGFELVGVVHEVGHKFGRWVDTAWYQRFGPVDAVR